MNYVVHGSEEFLKSTVCQLALIPEPISHPDLSGYYRWIRDTESGIALAQPNAVRFDQRVIIWSIDSYGSSLHKSVLEIMDAAIKWQRTLILHLAVVVQIPATIRSRARIIVEPQLRRKPKFLTFDAWAAQLLHHKR